MICPSRLRMPNSIFGNLLSSVRRIPGLLESCDYPSWTFCLVHKRDAAVVWLPNCSLIPPAFKHGVKFCLEACRLDLSRRHDRNRAFSALRKNGALVCEVRAVPGSINTWQYNVVWEELPQMFQVWLVCQDHWHAEFTLTGHP